MTQVNLIIRSADKDRIKKYLEDRSVLVAYIPGMDSGTGAYTLSFTDEGTVNVRWSLSTKLLLEAIDKAPQA